MGITRIYNRPGTHRLIVDPIPGELHAVTTRIICGGGGGGGSHKDRGGNGGGGGACTSITVELATKTGVFNAALRDHLAREFANDQALGIAHLYAARIGYSIIVGGGGRGGTVDAIEQEGGKSTFFLRNEDVINNIICQADGGGAPNGGIVLFCIPRSEAQPGGLGKPSSFVDATPVHPAEGSINTGSVSCSGGGGSGATEEEDGYDAGVGNANWPGGGQYDSNGLPHSRFVAKGANGLIATGIADQSISGGAQQSSTGGGGGGGRGGFYITNEDPDVVAAFSNGTKGRDGCVLIYFELNDEHIYDPNGFCGMPRPITSPC